MFERKLMQMFYDQADGPTDLPWHEDEPGRLLEQAAQLRTGKALDLGCGSGVFSVFLAEQGFQVTAIDYIPKALDFARRRAAEHQVDITWVGEDLLNWSTDERFDLILDSGTFHNMSGASTRRYKARLLSWLAPDGDYVLGHWGKRHALDWRPVGPRRRSKQTLVRFFSPELTEHRYEQVTMDGIPLPMGPTVVGQSIWFKRSA